MGSVLVVIKGVAFALSGSVAVLSSLADSVMDVVVSGMHYGAIIYSARPADDDHRYGHGKIEGLSALGQALILALVAVFLLAEAAQRAAAPSPIEAPIATLSIMGASLVISMIIIFIQNRAIAQSQSLVVEADQAHYSADVAQHIGVIIVIAASYAGAPLWLDALLAVVIALWMGRSALKVGRKGVDMILDRELPSDERHALLKLIRAHDLVLGVHDLRAIRHGMKELISFDIEAAPEMTLHDAHAITKDLEAEILTLYPAAEIMIHVDPHGEIEDSRHTVADIHH